MSDQRDGGIAIPVHRIPVRSCKAKGRAMAVVVAHAIVDDDRADLAAHFWTLHSGYACRSDGGRCVFMHHEVAGRVPGLDVSHENANKLDNRRKNLKHATRSANMLNAADGARRNRSSCPFRGVTSDGRGRSLKKAWRGKLRVNGKTYQTVRFETPEEARDALEALRSDLKVRQFPQEGKVT